MKRLLVAVVLALVACGAPAPESGTVEGNKYDDPDSWITMMCVSYNKDGFCQVSIPVENHDGAHWYLRLRPSDGEAGWRQVTEREFANCGYREHYPGCGMS